MKDLLEGLSYIIVILGGIISSILYIKKFNADKSSHLDNIFSGSFGNEGNVGGETPSHYLELKIMTKNGRVDGILCSRNLTSGSYWNGLSVIGKRNRNKISLDAIHIRGGKINKMFSFTIAYKKGEFKWKTKSLLENDCLPKNAVIWKFCDK
jgi:hypothetical protein